LKKQFDEQDRKREKEEDDDNQFNERESASYQFFANRSHGNLSRL